MKDALQSLQNRMHPSLSSLAKRLDHSFVLLIILFAALLLRLVFAAQYTAHPIFETVLPDRVQFEQFATGFLQGDFDQPDAYYMSPLYPFFLTVVYGFFGIDRMYAVFAQSFLDTFNCLLVFILGSTAFNRKTGLLAAFVYALYGIAIFFSGLLLESTLVTAIVLATLIVLIKARERDWRTGFWIAGLLLGLAYLGRPNLLLFAGAMPLWMLGSLRDESTRTRSLCHLVCMAGGFAAVMLLITVKNGVVSNHWTPVSPQAGINFYIGNSKDAEGYMTKIEGVSDEPITQIKTSLEVAEKKTGRDMTLAEASRYWLLKGVRYWFEEPAHATRLYAKKFAMFWRKEEVPLNTDYSFARERIPVLRLPYFAFGLVAPLALAGMGLSLLRRRQSSSLLIWFVLIFMLSVVLFFVTDRYRFPVAPILILFACHAIFRGLDWLRARRWKATSGLALGTAALAIPINISSETHEFNDMGKSHYELANVYFEKHFENLKTAISEFESALEENPVSIEAAHNMGVAHAVLENHELALSAFAHALRIDPRHEATRSNLQRLLTLICNPYSQKKFDLNEIAKFLYENNLAAEATAIYEELVRREPRNTEALFNLGITYAEQEDLPRAIELWKKALEIDPTYTPAKESIQRARSMME